MYTFIWLGMKLAGCVSYFWSSISKFELFIKINIEKQRIAVASSMHIWPFAIFAWIFLSLSFFSSVCVHAFLYLNHSDHTLPQCHTNTTCLCLAIRLLDFCFSSVPRIACVMCSIASSISLENCLWTPLFIVCAVNVYIWFLIVRSPYWTRLTENFRQNCTRAIQTISRQ